MTRSTFINAHGRPDDYITFADARTAVDNSGVADWDWGEWYNDEKVLHALAQYCWQHNLAVDAALPGFIRDKLGQDPADYGVVEIAAGAGS